MDMNRTQMAPPPIADPNRTIMGQAPTLNATQTIKPVQCPVCKTFNPVGVLFCVDCGLIFDRALPADAFGAPTVQMPCLVDASGREHVLRPGETVLGRQGDIVLEDARVSRRHAAVVLNGQELTVRDLGSTNGTKLEGEPLAPEQPRPFTAGQKLSLGGLELTLTLPGESAKTSMPSGGKTAAMSAAPALTPAVARWVGESMSFELKSGPNTFGRRDGNDLVISDPYVSGKHGLIEVEENAVYLTDLGSTNGTVLNGAKLPANQRTRLEESDVVSLGALSFRLERI